MRWGEGWGGDSDEVGKGVGCGEGWGWDSGEVGRVMGWGK